MGIGDDCWEGKADKLGVEDGFVVVVDVGKVGERVNAGVSVDAGVFVKLGYCGA